ncbi:hypothetical protein SAMN05216474_1053 [Lishizhenia tianjinensis]|uniref:Outer membrane protein beta-barrel domain-containing protein n=1 Tax=Lishizhenia tianjinensis TaxID=477690 RepID=A0A1I6YNQ2_9FLAO|nr:hypothetical protein [Lishizhenia tianjinensis]SFT52106.1 hypothetical protein SAMN05216474_1053 [Lishizhenia tianjinensis]
MMNKLLAFLCLSVGMVFPIAAQKNESENQLKPKQEARYIAPNALFIGVHVGGARMLNKMEGAFDVFENGGFMGQNYGVSVEKGLAKNFYWSSAASIMEVWDKRSYQIGPFSGDGGNAFWATQVGLNLGYRVIGPKNYNYFNVAVGIQNGFALAKKGELGGSSLSISGSDYQEGDLYSYSASHHLTKGWYTALSFHLSKDFKLYKGVYFNVAYNTQFGFRKIFVSNIDYYLHGEEQSKSTSAFMDGTQQQLMLGLKYKF